jgi:hypothetical protein
LTAADEDGVVGDSTYAKDEQISRRKAKVAALVEDGWRSRGSVGGLLLSETSREARRGGVETLTCVTLGENRRILSLVRRVFPDVRVSYAAGALLIWVLLYESDAWAAEKKTGGSKTRTRRNRDHGC